MHPDKEIPRRQRGIPDCIKPVDFTRRRRGKSHKKKLFTNINPPLKAEDLIISIAYSELYLRSCTKEPELPLRRS